MTYENIENLVNNEGELLKRLVYESVRSQENTYRSAIKYETSPLDNNK